MADDDDKPATPEQIKEIWAEYDAMSPEKKAELFRKRMEYQDGELELEYQPSDMTEADEPAPVGEVPEGFGKDR